MKNRTIQKRRAREYRRKFDFRRYGFPEEWTYDVNWTIVKFTLPILKRFKEANNGYPAELTPESWDDIIQKIIDGFELVIKNDDDWSTEKEEQKKIDEAFELFGKWLRYIWW